MQNEVIENDQNCRKLGLKMTIFAKEMSILQATKVKMIENDENVRKIGWVSTMDGHFDFERVVIIVKLTF